MHLSSSLCLVHTHWIFESCTEDLRERIPCELFAMHVVAKDVGMQISDGSEIVGVRNSFLQLPTMYYYLQQNLKLESVTAGEGDVVEQLLKPGCLPLKVPTGHAVFQPCDIVLSLGT